MYERIHGIKRSDVAGEYISWVCMKRRCLEKSHHKFSSYGGRGIKICAKWVYSFSAFLADMGRKPSSGHTLDRINNDSDYTPQNCKWSCPSEQAANRRRKNGKLVYFHKRDMVWVSQTVIKGVRYRIGSFKSEIDAKLALLKFMEGQQICGGKAVPRTLRSTPGRFP